MVKKPITIGVIGIQGAVSEHIIAMQKTFKKTQVSGKVILIKNKEEISDIDALIIPGGESTTISRVLYKNQLHEVIHERIQKDKMPVMGTCAGCVILSSKIKDMSKDIKLLNLMSMEVTRNAFGRQRESFEQNIDITGFNKPYNAIFIRAPIITKIWDACEILGKIDKKIVMVRQDNSIALSFHPELTDDLRIHKYFLDMIINKT